MNSCTKWLYEFNPQNSTTIFETIQLIGLFYIAGLIKLLDSRFQSFLLNPSESHVLSSSLMNLQHFLSPSLHHYSGISYTENIWPANLPWLLEFASGTCQRVLSQCSILRINSRRVRISSDWVVLLRSRSQTRRNPTITPFVGHPERHDILISFWSILKIRVEKGKLPWIDLRFEYKT